MSWKESGKAILYVSCKPIKHEVPLTTTTLLYLGCTLRRAQFMAHLHSYRLGVLLQTLGAWDHFYMYVVEMLSFRS